jgi:cystathionine beta-lyase
MKYNFDEPVNRKNTSSVKYDALLQRFGNNDLLPLWVADMDFRICPKISQRFKNIIEHGIFGYHIINNNYFTSVINWLKNRHNYSVEKEEIFFVTGVVPAVHHLIKAFTEKGDGILIQTPVYYPFLSMIKQIDRKLIINKLYENDNIYSIDFDDFEKKASESKLFILCNPHNPVSRVWRKDEILKMSEICLKHDVLIISDEIHSDIVFNGNKHIPVATLSDEIRKKTITCSSASKTFNLAALNTAYLIIHSKENRLKLKSYTRNNLVETPNIFGLEALSTAYNNCDDWLNELLIYIFKNYQFMTEYIRNELPFINYSPLEGTYLVWLDFRALNKTDDELKKHIIEKAGLALNDGPIFGPGGSGFQRINIACPLSTLEKALDMLKKSFE